MVDLPVKITGNVPDKAMGRLAESLADLISPITETTGLIGDSLKFHREQMAERRVMAALEKAKRLGLVVEKAPYKFMVGWLEAATVENENSPLNELWENLLVAGITNYQSYLEMFISILRELGGSEVQVLRQLAERHRQLDCGARLVPDMAEEDEFPELLKIIVTSDAEYNDIWHQVQW